MKKTALLFLMSLLLTTACGQSGRLVLPEAQPAAKPKPAPATPAAVVPMLPKSELP